MATTIGRLSFLVAADSSGVAAGLAPGQAAIQRFASVANSTLSGGAGGGIAALLGGAAGGFLGAAGAAAIGKVTSALSQGAHQALENAANYEMMARSFDVLVGSASQAERVLGALKSLARTTVLEEQPVIRSAQVLMQFGVEASKTAQTVRMLGNIAMGDGERLERLALAFGQMHAAGKLMGQDLLQMINAGFNPLQEISKKTGESMMDLRKRMEQGGISTAEVTAAFEAATQAGGRFNNMLEAMGGSLKGLRNQLAGEQSRLSREVGNMMSPLSKTWTAIKTDFTRAMADGVAATNRFFGTVDQRSDTTTQKLKKTASAAKDLVKALSPEELKKQNAGIARTIADQMAGNLHFLNMQADELGDKLKAIEERHEKAKRDLTASMQLVGPAERFTAQGAQAIAESRRSQEIATQLKVLNDTFKARTRPIEQELEEVNRNIKEFGGKVTVREVSL